LRNIKTIIKLIREPNTFFFVLISKGNSKWMPDPLYLKLLYRLRFHSKLNLKKPETYNEKLQWLKLHDKNEEYCIDVDKFEVRNKIAALLGEEYLVPLLKVYNKPDEINVDELPEQFVLKCTHGTHCSVVCKNKENLDVKKTKKELGKWLQHNYFYDAREWPYKEIKPRIIAEKYISDKNDELIDYKFMCFQGKVKLILVHQDISNDNGKHTLDIYTPDWKKTDIEWGISRSEKILPKPNSLEKCIEISEILSKHATHVRVDLYIVDEKIYFGELTYYTAAGLKPFKRVEDDLLLGSWIKCE
jgi:hypothetical protein